MMKRRAAQYVNRKNSNNFLLYQIEVSSKLFAHCAHVVHAFYVLCTYAVEVRRA